MTEFWQKVMEKGMEKGRTEEKQRIAQNLISMNMDLHDVEKATGIGIDKLREMKQAMQA